MSDFRRRFRPFLIASVSLQSTSASLLLSGATWLKVDVTGRVGM
jgi:hypothetical protein